MWHAKLFSSLVALSCGQAKCWNSQKDFLAFWHGYLCVQIKASLNGLECLWACWKGQELSKMGAVTQYPGEGDVESWFLGVGKAWNTDKRKKKEIRCIWGENRGKWKGQKSPGIEPRTPGLCSQYSATELWQLDNYQPSQSSIYTAQVPQSHTQQPLGMCRQNPVRGQPENSLHQERTHSELFFSV